MVLWTFMVLLISFLLPRIFSDTLLLFMVVRIFDQIVAIILLLRLFLVVRIFMPLVVLMGAGVDRSVFVLAGMDMVICCMEVFGTSSAGALMPASHLLKLGETKDRHHLLLPGRCWRGWIRRSCWPVSPWRWLRCWQRRSCLPVSPSRWSLPRRWALRRPRPSSPAPR